MKSVRFIFKFCYWLIVLSLATLAMEATALSQKSASIRGTAKVDGSLVVEGVMVVAIPSTQKGRPTGKPIPSRVNKAGEYRIEDISSGSYTIKAVGKLIRTKVKTGVVIDPGNSNILDLKLERAPDRTRMLGKILDGSGAPLSKVKITIYSPDLAHDACQECSLAEMDSDETGTISCDDLSALETYDLVVQVNPKGEANASIVATTVTLTAANSNQLELRLNTGSELGLTARIVDQSPSPQQLRSPEQRKRLVETASQTYTRSVQNGAQMTIKGVVTRRDSETFVVRDLTGTDTVVRLSENTTTQSKDSGMKYAQTQILRGLNLEVKGIGNADSELVADKIKFSESDLRFARAVDARIEPLEERSANAQERMREVEQNAQKLSGQLDELAAVSNAAKGGAKAAQQTADAAVAGVTAANERISALDDYEATLMTAVLFRPGSSELSSEGKLKLDELSAKAGQLKAYVLEVTGYADSTGNTKKNRMLSQRRADSVIRYLTESQRVPLRRIVAPYGYGSSEPVADNRTRAGRALNRRVEVRILINRGINQKPGGAPR